MNGAPVGKGNERLEDQARCVCVEVGVGGAGAGVHLGGLGRNTIPPGAGQKRVRVQRLNIFPKTASMVPQCEACKITVERLFS